MTPEQIIKRKLKNTKKLCHFKNAWIPKGWACVHITEFAKEMAKELKK